MFAAIGTLPDIDLLFGAHSGPTHSVGAALLVTLMAWGVSGFRARPAMNAAVFAAYASHVALDWLGEDTSAPFGVMALWPFSQEYFLAPFQIMPAITRRYWLQGFWAHNLRAVMFEMMVIGPILAGVFWFRRTTVRQP